MSLIALHQGELVQCHIKYQAKYGFQQGWYLNKMVGSSGSSKQVKQRKIDLKTKVITNNQLLTELKQKEQEDKEKEQWKLERKCKAEERKEKKVEKQKTKKKIKMDYCIESDENVVLEEETTKEEIISDYEEEKNERNDTSDEEKINEDKDSDDPADLLKKVWKGISPPTPEDEVMKQWYGAIYQEKKNLICTLGKLLDFCWTKMG